ncbi:HNH endonuclease [Planococcus sp. 1R117A]|uniref:HNH endonuclease n=1 Tax=Planococcus sp. 1R117A TaxID=3447020 RepID=UPI003EDC4735
MQKKKEIIEFLTSNFDVTAFPGSKNKYQSFDLVNKENTQFYKDSNHLYNHQARHMKGSLNWFENPSVWIRVISIDERKRGKGLAIHIKCQVENWTGGRSKASELYYKKWNLPFQREGIKLRTPKGKQLIFSILNEEVAKFNLTDAYFFDYLKHTYSLYYENLAKLFEGVQSEQTLSSFKQGASEQEPVQDFQKSKTTDAELEKNIDLDVEAEEVEDGYGIEGRVANYYGKRFERNSKNRKLAIKKHGLDCFGCGFNFEKKYGERGKDFVEVHHINPLSTLTEATEVNPETDLIPLCANCHRMVHRRKDDVLTLQSLRNLLKE